MNFHLSDYELNARDPNAIVYRDAYGKITRLTRTDFSSEEEFKKWKMISDADLHERHKGNLVEMQHTISIETVPSSMMPSSPSSEDLLIANFEAEYRREQVMKMMDNLSEMLTKIQFRRLWMYIVDGLSQEEIAAIENVGQQRVSKSIQQALRVAKNIISIS